MQENDEATVPYVPPRPMLRASATTVQRTKVYTPPQVIANQYTRLRSRVEEEVEDDLPRTNTSVRRYRPPEQPVVVQVKEEPTTQPLQGWTFQRFATWVCFSIGISLILIVAFLVFVLPRIVDVINTAKYENPRITQADVMLNGQAHHLVALNEHGKIEVIDLPSDMNKQKPTYYVVVRLVGDGMDKVPVTAIEANDANGDGYQDIEVTVNNTQYILYGDGKGDFSQVPPTKGK